MADGFANLITTSDDELSDAQIVAGINLWANLTGLYDGKTSDDIARMFGISDKRKVWKERIRPSIDSILTEPRTALEIIMMTEEERRKEFDSYWRKKNPAPFNEQAEYAMSSAFAPYMSGFAGTNVDSTPPEPPKIKEATEADYESWINEKTFGLQRVQLEGALLSTDDPEKARLAWIVALSDMSNEEKEELIRTSTNDTAERREIAQAAYWMNPELDYGFWRQMVSKSGDALIDFSSNVWNFTTDSIPEMGRDILIKAGLSAETPIGIYEQIEEAGGLENILTSTRYAPAAKYGKLNKCMNSARPRKAARKFCVFWKNQIWQDTSLVVLLKMPLLTVLQFWHE